MQRAFILNAAFFCCILRCGIAQESLPTGSGNVREPALEHRELPKPQPQPVYLDAVVTDKSGNPIAGLKQADFTLLDNGQPSPITSFSAFSADASQAAPSVEAVLVFDAVNVGFREMAIARAQVETFLRQNGGKLALPVSILWMTSGGWMELSPSTRDGNALAAQLETVEGRLRSIPAPNSFYGALDRFRFSVPMMEGIGAFEAGKPGRKLLIWIGPGWPLMNGQQVDVSYKDQVGFFTNIVTLSSELRQARIAVYSVILGTPGGNIYAYRDYVKGVKRLQLALPPDLNLKVLAVQSGGRVMTPSNDLVVQLNDCLRDAGSFYTLSFMPPKADGPNEYHELKLKMQKAGLMVRTTTGYYNQP